MTPSAFFATAVIALQLGAAQASQPAPATAVEPGPSSQPGPASQPAAHEEDVEQTRAQKAPVDREAPPGDDATPAAAPDEGSSSWSDFVFGTSSGPQTAGQVAGRPGASENAVTLRKGSLLVDGALHVDSTIQDGLLLTATQLNAPVALVRVGLFDYLEIRAGAVYSVTTTGIDENASPPPPVQAGLSAITLGGTARILEEDDLWPGMAMLVDSAVPISTLRLNGFSARGLVMVQKTFFQRFQLASNLGGAWDGANERFGIPYTVVGALDIGLGVGCYAELFGELPVDLDLENLNFNNLAERAPSVWGDGGIYVDVGPSLRVDAVLGVNALGQQGAWFAEVGLTWLVPGMF